MEVPITYLMKRVLANEKANKDFFTKVLNSSKKRFSSENVSNETLEEDEVVK